MLEFFILSICFNIIFLVCYIFKYNKPENNIKIPKDPFKTKDESETKEFKMWSELNDPILMNLCGISGNKRTRRSRMNYENLNKLNPLKNKKLWNFFELITKENFISVKEFFETTEAFKTIQMKKGSLRCNSNCKEKILVEVAGGHCLFSAIVALVYPERFDRIIAIDLKRVEAFDKVMNCLRQISPVSASKIEFKQEDIKKSQSICTGSVVVALHACGNLTDVIISISLKNQVNSLNLMGCCYRNCDAAKECHPAIRNWAGERFASSITRTLKLQEHKYDVNWKFISTVITPQNQVIIAVKDNK